MKSKEQASKEVFPEGTIDHAINRKRFEEGWQHCLQELALAHTGAFPTTSVGGKGIKQPPPFPVQIQNDSMVGIEVSWENGILTIRNTSK